MDEEVQELELIDRYLSGELDARDRQAFEARLQSEPELQEKVEEMQWLQEGGFRTFEITLTIPDAVAERVRSDESLRRRIEQGLPAFDDFDRSAVL